MKKIMILMGWVLFTVNIVAQNTYYVSNSGNDTNNGLTEQTAWKTTLKVEKESSNLKPGDVISFKGGDEFFGQLTLSRLNGSSGNPITFTSYGTGKAYIKGSLIKTNWKKENGNIWSSQELNNVYQVFRNGKNVQNAKSQVYKITSKSSNTEFISKDLIGHADITGGTIFTRTVVYFESSAKVVGFNSSTGKVTLAESPRFGLSNGKSFEIVNHNSVMNEQNEWFYDKGKVYLYSISKPTNISVAINELSGIELNGCDYIKIENLHFKEINVTGVMLKNSENCAIVNNNFDYCYSNAIAAWGNGQNGFLAEKNYINGCMQWALYTGYSNSVVKDNIVVNVGTKKIYTYKKTYSGVGIRVAGDNSIVEGNRIDNMGYNAITFGGKNTVVKSNYITNFNNYLHDGAAIYTFSADWSKPTSKYASVVNNIIIGNSQKHGDGVYLDDLTQNVTVRNNYIENAKAGVYFHNNRNCIAEYNNIYKAVKGITMVEDHHVSSSGQVYGNKVFFNNIYLQENTNRQNAFSYNSYYNSNKLYTGDKNVYWNYSSLKTTNIYRNKAKSFTSQNLNDFFKIIGQEPNSIQNKIIIPNIDKRDVSRGLYNETNAIKTVSLPDGNWEDIRSGDLFSGSIILEPYQSKILILSDKSNQTTGFADAGDDVTICLGESTTLNASGGASYLWSNGATTKSIIVNPIETKTFSVTITDGNISDTDDVIVMVNTLTANAGSDQTISEGESISLTATGGDSYLWSTGETEESITVSPKSSVTYTVKATKGSCEDTDDVRITVNSSIGGGIKVVANAGPDQSICKGESLILTASGGSGYLWNTGATTKSITVNPVSTITYAVTVSEGDESDNDSVVVNVSEVFANAGADQIITEGESISLTGTGGDNYLWNTGEKTATINVSPSSTTTYSVTAINGSCEDTDDVKITVNPSAGGSAAVVANAGLDRSICLGENVTLTASGGSIYLWSTGASSKSITVSPSDKTIYKVTVSEGSESDTDEVTVDVNHVVANAGVDRKITEGETITLVAAGGDSYIWNTGERAGAITVSPTKTQTYSVTAYKGSCLDTDQVRVTVEPIIDSDLLPAQADAGEDMTICLGDNVELYGAGGNTYLWSTGETSNSILVSPQRTVTYELSATRGGVTNTDTVTITVENCNGVSEEKNEQNQVDEEELATLEMSLYPNPTDGELNIRIDNIDSELNFIVNDAKGSILHLEVLTGQISALDRDIDLSRYTSGLYFVRLFNAEQSLIKKVIVQ